MKIKNPAYTNSTLVDLFKRADEAMNQVKQSRKSERAPSYSVQDEAKSINLVGLVVNILENVTVFSVGGGGGYRKNFNSSLEDRLESFRAPLQKYLDTRKPETINVMCESGLLSVLEMAEQHFKTFQARNAHPVFRSGADRPLHCCVELLELLERQLFGCTGSGESEEQLTTRIHSIKTAIDEQLS